jgi:hypothetical protein
MNDNYTICPKCKGKAVKLFFSVGCDFCDGLVSKSASEIFVFHPSSANKQDIIDNSCQISWLKKDRRWLNFAKNEDDARKIMTYDTGGLADIRWKAFAFTSNSEMLETKWVHESEIECFGGFVFYDIYVFSVAYSREIYGRDNFRFENKESLIREAEKANAIFVVNPVLDIETSFK